MYEIIGKIGNEIVSRHYSNDFDYVTKVWHIESIRLLNGRILDLEVKKVNREGGCINSYVTWIKDCVKYNVCDCKLVPEFE